MQKSNVKINILAIVIAFIATVALSVAFMFAMPKAYAEGNDAGSENSNNIAISLDVNGKDALQGNDREYAVANITANNEKHYRKRYISSTAIAEQLGLTGAYTFDATTIYNGSSCFGVSVEENSSNMFIIVEAFKITDMGRGYFSIGITGAGGLVTASFSVDVTDTFVHFSAAESPISKLTVGLKPGAVGSGEVPASILRVNNYSKLQVDLGDYLLGRELFNAGTRIEDGSNIPWVLKSVSNFKITEVTFDVSGLVMKNPIFTQSNSYEVGTPPVRISPKLTGIVEVSDLVINGYNQSEQKDFWTAAHELRITLQEINRTSGGYQIALPIVFVPANPQEKFIASDKLRLNVTSENVYELSSGQRPSDYKSILITPSDLIEYSVPSTYRAMRFNHAFTKLDGSTELSGGCIIERVGLEAGGEDENGNPVEPSVYPSAYKISANSEGSDNSYNITLGIVYGDAEGGWNATPITVNISVSTYGGYKVSFPSINGKKSVSYNVLNAGVFAQMRERGYYLTAARSNDQTQLNAELENNVLTLTPNVANISGQTHVSVALTFTNNSDQKITFNSEDINIDVNAGSFFARFEDWQAWLIIAACILGGIILVLLVVWLFIHSISKHKQDELATQAPVSSYIVRLNNTIAATQAQQRMAQTQALSQASTMLLGAGPTGTAAPPPDTLQLASGMASIPSMPSSPSTPMFSEPQAAIPPDSENLEELIAKYITDEELLERIFTEKYEPKGMVRRTFFKSKDLQTRELEKEKKRIIERYKSPMPMDEAIMSENEIKNAEQSSTPAATSEPMMSEPQQTIAESFVLDFDPDAPLYVEPEVKDDEFVEEKIDIDASPEEARLKELERKNSILEKELEELKSRLSKIQSELDRAGSVESELREKIAKAESDDEQYGKDIEDLEFKLASARNKDKEKITRDIGIKEEKKKRNLEELEKLRSELDALLGSKENLDSAFTKLNGIQEQKVADSAKVAADREKAQAEYDAYLERLEKVRAKQALEAKVTELSPMLVAVNGTDYELRKLQAKSEQDEKERGSLKEAVAAAKAQIMSATDFDIINTLNTQISDANARLSELEKETTKATKRKSELNIDFNAQRRKANDFIEENKIPLEEVIDAEDIVIGNIELELLKAVREKDKEDAEKAVANAQAVYDDLSASSDDVTLIAMDVAANLKDIEDEIEAAQAELDAVVAQMANSTDDEQLMLMVDKGDKADKIEELKAKLEQATVDGTKRKMEAQSEYDAKLEDARKALAEVNAEFERACAAYDDLVHNTNPIDLIVSGSGVISQDQKKIEAESLKRQLERSKNEIEQARLAAQQAQMEAEQARIEAERKSEEARAEADKAAQEAIERAEQARLEAEERARAEVEAAEQARLEAEAALAAEAEEARRKAEEEAEEAKRKAQEESEEAKRKAQEESEEARRKAEEEAEEAKRKAQEEIEEMRRKAEEEAEAKRKEEEAKRLEEEERKKIEAERNETIAKKVAMRKEQIIAIRNDMKELKGDDDAKQLRERLYNIQLSYDEDERNSSELMDFYNKTMDDIQNSGEIARLKAENAKKPQRVVRKVTERVNRIPKRRPGAAGARPGARPAGARPGARPAGARPGARPAAGARPGARPAGARPGARPAGTKPGARPAGTKPGARPGARPSGNRPTRPK